MNYPEPNRVYRHYKGGLYRVLFLSKHTETGEILVNYQSIHFGSYYSRPLDLWNELVSDETSVLDEKIKRYEIEKEN